MKKPVLVLGGGIAGVQTALDLAEMKVPVFLVENSPSIGGRMAQLDKTFPTNDCSACILAPKVTSCFNHPFIKTFTWSELLEIKGEAPDFTVVINKKARFIDEDLCIGCNACTLKCPIDIKSEFDMEIGIRHAVYKPYAQAVPNKVVIEKNGTSPCTFNCPVHINAHGIVSLVRKGRFEEALKLARKVTPFIGVVGRICSGDCESYCYRKHVDSSVAVQSLERFIADYEVEQGKTPKMTVTATRKPNKVAVIGAGPAGLNCAYQLALKGYPITVFEQMTQPGGTLRVKTAESLLDAAVLDREIQLIADIGVQIECNVKVGKDLTIDGLREQGYQAFFLATGHLSGESITGITKGLVVDENGNIVCDEAGRIADSPDIFIGGENVLGSVTIVEAIAAGNRAAISISNYLEGIDAPQTPSLLPQTPIEEVDFKRGTPSVSTGREFAAKQAQKGWGEFTSETAKNEALRCMDCSICSECKACEQICSPKAIRHQQRDEVIEIPVSAVVLATGYDTSKNIPEIFGYKRYPNVVTSLEYERILSASGPYQGHVQRPSDKKAPTRIAFIQCVGSRDYKCNSDYCSAVCCMYAVKEAIITKEHLHTVRDIDIFYMDMRAYGKDFDKYIDSAKNKHGISFIRSRVADITQDEKTENLIIRYCDAEGELVTAEYDMVVLSVGLCSKPEIQPLMGKAGVKADGYGFCWVNEMNPPTTSKDGILACGVVAGPKDIPETVIEASAAAANASRISYGKEVDAEEYKRFFKKKEKAVLRDITKEPVRIGVFVCHCGTNIGGFLDVKDVVKYAKTLPFVEYCTDFVYACSLDTQKVIAERIKKFNLNRVVIASCTPRTHEHLFRQVLEGAGLNPYLFTMANIREQCSWVHMNQYEGGTSKAKTLVKMAVGKVTFAKPLTKHRINVVKSALVIGGGIAGIAAAQEISAMGYKVTLVEKTGKLGGNALRLNTTQAGRLVGKYLEKYVNQLMENPMVDIRLNTEVLKVDGYMGNFRSLVRNGEEEIEVSHGAVIVATGAVEYKPTEYLYDSNDNVVTQMELEQGLKSGDLVTDAVKKIVMIQCVGSRDSSRPYCSRVCCNQAIKNAIRIKDMNPDADIVILYRDIRTYGLNELSYREARKAGVRFIRYESERKPEVAEVNGKLILKVNEPILGENITMETDLLVLSSAIEPMTQENRKIAQMLKVPLNQDGFFLEAHAKLRPVDFATDGIYLCGLAHAPKNIKESITQGKAAAARAATVISKEFLETEGTIAAVSENLCTGCGTCEKVCAYKAISVEQVKQRDKVLKKAVVNSALCKGCGTCSASCRCGAVDISGFSDRQILNEIEYLLRT